MRFKYLKFSLLFIVLFSLKSNSQETLPIYQDYLSDNVFLIHPSAAGIGNSTKLRFTARKQWLDVPNAPALQTVSFHGKFGEYSKAGYGFVLFNDNNGFHSQRGFQGTYSYHLPLSSGALFQQLSFGLAFSFVQNQSDQTSFGSNDATGTIVSTNYYNADFSVAYHRGGLSSYFTVKNLLLTKKNNLNVLEPLDLRNFIFSAGYYFGEDNFVQFEPSFMLQFRESIGQRIADLNMKFYKTISETQLWVAASYRRSFDTDAIENSQFISPIIGINYKKYMFSYTYTNQINDIVLTSSGFHQITLGIDLWARKQRGAGCPNINSVLGGF